MKVVTLFILILAAVLLPVLLGGQDATTVPAAPIPEQLLTAKKVFISNAGTNPIFLHGFGDQADPNRVYNLFYAHMKTWGHFELVKAPGDADLVFAIRCTAHPAGGGTYQPQSEVTIFDAKTHFVLWTLTANVQDAGRTETFTKNLNTAFANLLNALRKVVSQPAAATPPN